jgi:predicted RNA-binding Zn ribbon-like protein
LLAIARAAADLVTSPSGTAVGACPGTGCGWLFTDLRRRRRWCSMAACGNRSKVRRHAERTRGAVA